MPRFEESIPRLNSVERAVRVLGDYVSVVQACHSSELERFTYAPEIEAAKEDVEQCHAGMLWTLLHNQGRSSPVGKPIRAFLGMGQSEAMTQEQINAAKAFAERFGR
jgi:hypothetical protein